MVAWRRWQKLARIFTMVRVVEESNPVLISSANSTSFGLHSEREGKLKVTKTGHTIESFRRNIHSHQLLLIMVVNSPHEVLCGRQPFFLHGNSLQCQEAGRAADCCIMQGC